MSDFFEDLENLNLHPPYYISENFFEAIENMNDVVLIPDEEEEELIRVSATGDLVLIPDGHGSLSRNAFLVGFFQGKPRTYREFTLPRHPTGAFSLAMVVLGCCNGVVCLCTSLDKNPVALWNPLTREYVYFPRNKGLRSNPLGCECSSCSEHDELESDEPVLASGFGYSLKGNVFKAVRVIAGSRTDLSLRRRSSSTSESGSRRDDDEEGYHLLGEVYTLGEEKWRKSKGIAPRISHSMSSGIYSKGKFYWVCSNKDCMFEFLAIFDFDDEQFGLIPPPMTATNKCASHIRLLDFQGQLSLFDFSSVSQISVSILWEPVPPNRGRRWMEGPVVRMSHSNVTEPIRVESSGNDEKVILLMHGSRTLVVYDTISEKFVILELKTGRCACYGAIAYVPTYFRFKNVAKRSGGHIQVLKIAEPLIEEDRFRYWPRFEPVTGT